MTTIEDCGVCFENVEDALTCGHKIHEDCVVKSGKSTCPICRAVVTLSEEKAERLKQVAETMRIEQIQEEQLAIFTEFGLTQEFVNIVNELSQVIAQQEVVWEQQERVVLEECSNILRAYHQLCETRQCPVPSTEMISVVSVAPHDGAYKVSVECRCVGVCACLYPKVIYYSQVDGDPIYHDI